jgi:hypothetical protein
LAARSLSAQCADEWLRERYLDRAVCVVKRTAKNHLEAIWTAEAEANNL